MFKDKIQSYINNDFVDSSGIAINNFNPSDGKKINTFNENSLNEVDNAIFSAREAQKSWEKVPAIERAGYLKKIGKKIQEHADEIVNVIVEEQGKIKSLAQGEVSFASGYFEYMAEWARRIEGEIITSDVKNENIFLLQEKLHLL